MGAYGEHQCVAVSDGESRTEVYLAYYVGSSMLHFLYDGWIWKLR